MDTIVALYDNIAHAQQVAERLVARGVAPDTVYVVKQEAEGTFRQIKQATRQRELSAELQEMLDEMEIAGARGEGAPEEIEQGGGMLAVGAQERLRELVIEEIEQYGLIDVIALQGEDSADLLRQATGDVVAGDFWINVEAAFKRHFQTRYAPKGFEFETYEPGYRFGYVLGREALESKPEGDGDWETEKSQIRERWQTHQRGEWKQFADAIEHGWRVGQGREPGRELDVSEIQTTVRGAQYGELMEEDQKD